MSLLPMDRADLIEIVGKAIKNWHRDDLATSRLHELRIVKNELKSHPRNEPTELALRLAVKSILQNALDMLAKKEPDYHNILQLRFMDKLTLSATSDQIHKSIPTIARNQNDAFESITDMLIEQEKEAAEYAAQDQEWRLPDPTYTKLFGVSDVIDNITKLLINRDDYFMVALVGMGGIGKSSLAREIARQVIRAFQFHDVIWIHFTQETNTLVRSPESIYAHVVSQLANKLVANLPPMGVAQQEKLIRQHITKLPYFIVIDNLELEHDIAPLVERLQSLTNPSKILFGSRSHPPQPTVYCYNLTEIPQNDAYEFVKYLTRNTNVDQVPPLLFTKIYKAVGGNPLALRLVVSLLKHLPFREILPTIENGRDDTYQMYQRIYLRIWRVLTAEAKAVLMAMAMADLDLGIESDDLKELCMLDANVFWRAIRELRYNSLLEYHGTAEDRTYTIHRLTETFILKDIVKLFDDL